MADIIFLFIFFFSLYFSITMIPYLPLIYLMLLSQFKLWLIYDSGIKLFQYIDPTLLFVVWITIVTLKYDKFQFVKLLKKPIILSHFIFCFMYIISLFWSPYFFGYDKVIRFVIINTILLCTPYILFSDMTSIKTYIHITAILTVIICFKIILWPSWNHPPVDTFRNIYFLDFLYRPGFIYSGSNLEFYVILSGCYFFSMVMNESSRNIIRTFIVIICLIIIHVYPIISGIRKLIAVLFVAEVIYAFMSYRRNRLRIVLIVPILLALNVVLFSYLKIYDTKYQIATSRILYKIGNPKEAMNPRIEFYSKAIDLFVENYFLGVGAGGYSANYGEGKAVTFPHNLFLEVIAEQGLIGLLLFITFFVLYLDKIVRLFYRKNYFVIHADNKSFKVLLVVMSSSLAMWVFYQFATDLPGARPLWLIIGLMLSISKILDRGSLSSTQKII